MNIQAMYVHDDDSVSTKVFSERRKSKQSNWEIVLRSVLFVNTEYYRGDAKLMPFLLSRNIFQILKSHSPSNL